jgi:hypothetical protein
LQTQIIPGICADFAEHVGVFGEEGDDVFRVVVGRSDFDGHEFIMKIYFKFVKFPRMSNGAEKKVLENQKSPCYNHFCPEA